MENKKDLTREEFVRHNPELEFAKEVQCIDGYVYYICMKEGIPSLKRVREDGLDVTTLYAGTDKAQQSGWCSNGSYALSILSITGGYVRFSENSWYSNDCSNSSEYKYYKVKSDGSEKAVLYRRMCFSEDPNGEFDKEWTYDDEGNPHEITKETES